MAGKSGLINTKNAVEEFHKGLVAKAGNAQAMFARDIYKIYVASQKRRWETENSSEGDRWAELSPATKISKRKRWAGAPGAGNVMMVQSSFLVKNVTGEDLTAHRRLITPKVFEVSLDPGVQVAAYKGRPFSYAKFTNKIRPYMRFGKVTIDKMRKALKKYFMGA